MDYIQFFTVIGLFIANFSLICWFRTESRNDWLHMDAKLEATSQQNQALIEAIRQDIKQFRQEMYQEVKDFHGRLCAIEERRK